MDFGAQVAHYHPVLSTLFCYVTGYHLEEMRNWYMQYLDLAPLVLHKHWEAFCSLAGDHNLQDVILGVQEGGSGRMVEPVPGGDDFDMQFTLEVLVEAATLIKICVEMYALLKKSKKSDPTEDELLDALQKQRASEINDLARVKDKLALITTEITNQ